MSTPVFEAKCLYCEKVLRFRQNALKDIKCFCCQKVYDAVLIQDGEYQLIERKGSLKVLDGVGTERVVRKASPRYTRK